MLGRFHNKFSSHLNAFWASVVVALAVVTSPVSANQYDVELLDETDGFTSSIIFSIAQDKRGFLWFGTAYDGLLRYDGKNVVNYRREPGSRYYIEHNTTGNINVDRDGHIWVGGWGSGAMRLDPVSHQATYFTSNINDTTTISDQFVQEVFTDDEGDIWIGTSSTGLNRFLGTTQRFERYPFDALLPKEQGTDPRRARIWSIAQLNTGALWIGAENGLNYFDKRAGTFDTYYPVNPNDTGGRVNRVRFVEPISSTVLAVGTQQGVYWFDTKTQLFTPLGVENSIELGPIYSILKTSMGQIWVTSDRGLYYFTESEPVLKKVPLGVEDGCGQTLFEDKQATIWLTCEGLGVYKIVPKNTFKTFSHPLAQTAYSLAIADNGDLLLGTQAEGIFRWDKQNNRLVNLWQHSGQLSPPVHRIIQVSNGDIWFTDSDSLYVIDSEGIQRRVTVPKGTPGADFFRGFTHILQASDGKIWVGTQQGIFVISDVTEPFRYFTHDKLDPFSLSNDHINELYEDRQGRIWATTHGVNLWLPDEQKFQRVLTKGSNGEMEQPRSIYAVYQDTNMEVWVGGHDGLFLFDETSMTLTRQNIGTQLNDIKIHFIIGDEDNNLWLVSDSNLVKFMPDRHESEVFTQSDGLSGARYYLNSFAQGADKTIYLSSRDGIHYFNPADVPSIDLNSPTVLTHFEILGRGDTNRALLQQLEPLQLQPDENYLKFEFSTLDIVNARRIEYRYKLEGLDDKWLDNGTSNSVLYSNIPGGDYQFRVQGVIKNNLAYSDELVIPLHVATPLWRQNWMIAVYVLFLLFLIQRYTRYRNQKNAAEIERQKVFVAELEHQVAEKTQAIRQESKKLAAANQVKSVFLANMSHEIRTPLTAIIGSTEAILEGEIKGDDIHEEVKLIHRSSYHLLELLNDILDVSKIEENKLEIAPYNQDIHELLDDLEKLFSGSAQTKGIEFKLVRSLPQPFVVYVDGLRLKQVLINLCANAIKFTPAGQVSVIVSRHKHSLTFNVVDTGIGIAKDRINSIFDVFTQEDASISRRFGGSGLGLSIAYRLVMLMGGELSVSSEQHKGSSFSFSIPFDEPVLSPQTAEPAVNTQQAVGRVNARVLLADDHPDNKRIISRLLSRLGCDVAIASDGDEAIAKVESGHFDLILMDIQMPNKDGIQTFQELRSMGCSTPIIALTANVMSEDVAKYESLGFNDYLAKPIVRSRLIDIIQRYCDLGSDHLLSDKALRKIDNQDVRADFTARLSREIEHLQQLSVSDRDAIAEAAHYLAGAAFILGFEALGNAARTLELKASNSDAPLAEAIAKLITEMKNTRSN